MKPEENIMYAVATIVDETGDGIVRRVDVRDILGLNAYAWQNKYTSIFQSMRSDEPGGAPGTTERFRDVFRLSDINVRGEFVLTDYGRRLVEEFRHR